MLIVFDHVRGETHTFDQFSAFVVQTGIAPRLVSHVDPCSLFPVGTVPDRLRGRARCDRPKGHNGPCSWDY